MRGDDGSRLRWRGNTGLLVLFVGWAKMGLGLVGLSWDWIWFLVELNLGSG